MPDLEVIGAGCGRTGTASLKKALEILGHPTYHMFEVIKNGHERKWEVALASPQTADWPGIFAGFTATVDFPASVAWAANKRFEISNFNFKLPRART